MQLHDTAFGQLVRVLSGGKFFAHIEQSSALPPTWLKEGSQHTTLHDDSQKELDHNGANPSDWILSVALWVNGSRTATSSPSGGSSDNVSDAASQSQSDKFVTWYGDNDPANPQNWSSSYKAFIAGLICLYTFAVYLGSAIYTPSVMGVMQEYGVSYAAASLGLALFVLGCKSITNAGLRAVEQDGTT